jgi:hypothetical protein
VIYELRTYQIQVGKVPEFLANFEKLALPVISKYAELVGYWSADPGPLNHVYHLWRYNSLDHRTERRAALARDPAWQPYLDINLKLVLRQESTILNPTAFSPLK